MQKKLTLANLDISGKRVLVRVDYNVPLDSSGHITDDTRIRATLPTIQEILSQGGSLILMSHLGRPKEGDREPSLNVCAQSLSKMLGKEILFASDCVGEDARRLAQNLKPGQILLLENLRFHSAEEKPERDPLFAKTLASLGDCYVNDAFGTAHRAHSSTATVASYFPGKAAAGLLMEKEIEALTPLITNPSRPFAALIGGAKISTKIGLLKAILPKVDQLYIGGGMLFSFLKAQGHPIGDSICDEEFIDTAAQFLDLCRRSATDLIFPKDILIADKISEDAQTRVIEIDEPIPKGWSGVDIGPQTIEVWKNSLSEVKSLFWNGPMGIFEIKPFAKGTEELAKNLAPLKAYKVIGGGDSSAAISALHLESNFSHISTGGGAALEFIEYGHLPGIDALSDAKP